MRLHFSAQTQRMLTFFVIPALIVGAIAGLLDIWSSTGTRKVKRAK